MPILTKLKEVLDEAKIPYEIYNHPQAFTAQETAASTCRDKKWPK